MVFRRQNSVKKRRFIQNALLLALVTILLRGVGTGFSIYISNTIGAEGMGLYQLAASVYFLAITLATSGVTIAVTRLVSEQMALGSTRGARSAFRRCFAISLGFGTLAGVLLFFTAEPLGVHFLRDSRTVLSLRLFSAGLPFLSASSVIRGYFLGLSRPVMAVSGDIAEQLVTIAVTVPLLHFFLPSGLEWGCCALVLGSVLAELFSCLYAGMLYLKSRPPLEGAACTGINRKIAAIALPIAAGNYIRSLLNTLENALIPAGLCRHGADNSGAMAQYGLLKGMAMPMLTFPSVILSAFASLLVPEVSSANAIGDRKKIDFITERCFQATLLFAIWIMAVFFCYSEGICGIFYQEKQVGTILRMLTPLIPLLYLDQIVDSILKGLNQQLAAMKYNTADAVLRVLIIYFLVPLWGIWGYLAMFYAGTIFNASMSIGRLISVSRVRFQAGRWLLRPLAAAGAASLILRLLPAGLPIVWGIVLMSMAYLLLIFLLNCVGKEDILWLQKVFTRR